MTFHKSLILIFVAGFLKFLNGQQIEKECQNVNSGDISYCTVDEKIEQGLIDWSLNDLEQDDPKLIQILKEKYLIPPSKKPRNLMGQATVSNLHGQFGQPALLDELYFKGKKKKGFFIEAGAYDGEQLSNTLYFELKYQWTGLLVEPNTKYFDQLVVKNRDAWAFGHCLSTKTKPEVVMFDNAGVLGGIINPETGKKPGSEFYKGPRSVAQIQCFPLYSILMAIGNPKVDYFSLDVEGAEISILETIPWNKVNIETVGIEVNHLGEIFPGNYTDVEILMTKNGYEYLGTAQIDAFFVKKKSKKKSKKKVTKTN